MKNDILLTFVMKDSPDYSIACNDYTIVEELLEDGTFEVNAVSYHGKLTTDISVSLPIDSLIRFRVTR